MRECATQHAAIAALQGDQSCVDDMLTAFKRRAALITNLLDQIEGISCQAPSGAFYAFANIWKPIFIMAFQEKLLEEYGVAGIAGTSFGDFGEGYIRLSCANSDEAIEQAVARLKQTLISGKQSLISFHSSRKALAQKHEQVLNVQYESIDPNNWIFQIKVARRDI